MASSSASSQLESLLEHFVSPPRSTSSRAIIRMTSNFLTDEQSKRTGVAGFYAGTTDTCVQLVTLVHHKNREIRRLRQRLRSMSASDGESNGVEEEEREVVDTTNAGLSNTELSNASMKHQPAPQQDMFTTTYYSCETVEKIERTHVDMLMSLSGQGGGTLQ